MAIFGHCFRFFSPYDSQKAGNGFKLHQGYQGISLPSIEDQNRFSFRYGKAKMAVFGHFWPFFQVFQPV